MTEKFPTKHFLRCIMLYEFHQKHSAAVATRNICNVYGDKINVRTCQHWFKRFKSGDYSLVNKSKSGRPCKLDDDILMTEMESNPESSIRKLANRLNCSRTTVQNHLKKVGKVWRNGVWVPGEVEEEKEEVQVKKLANQIAKLNKIPHPKGRKTAQLAKKTIKAAGREKSKLLIQMKMNIVGEKYLWFKENLEPVENYTPELLIDLIEKYLSRFDEELEQIKIKHNTGQRKGRQHASREDIINMTIKNERNEFLTCGIELPDILNKKQLNLLRNWSGELRYLQNFKSVRYTKGRLENLVSKSSQPPPIEVKQEEEMETGETFDNVVEKSENPEEITIENNIVIKEEVDL